MKPLLIAHRGDSAHAPENTLPAFEQAVAKGADWIELDLLRSADGVVVVSHDEDLWRRARRPGAIDRLSAAELGEVDVSVGYPRFAGTGIPTLAATLGSVGRRVPLYLELKSNGSGRRDPRNRALLERCLEQVGPGSEHALASFDAGLVRGALAAGRNAVLILKDPAVLDRLSAAEREGLLAISVRKDKLGHPRIRRLLDGGHSIWAWTTDGASAITEALDQGASAVCSNDVGEARGVLDRWRS